MTSRHSQNAFIEALTRHQPALEAFCRAHLARREDVAEVLQAASVRLWEKSADWDTSTDFLPWAFTVTRYVVLSHVRDRMRDRLVLDEDVVMAISADSEEAARDYDGRRERLELCLRRLGSEERSLLSSHYLEGRSLASLAESTGRTRSALKMRLLRLRIQLVECIGRHSGRTA